ncbi:hypothetical protein BU17DRAFT_50348 [Hysterangium stoloniferum]|nr:hypothetical protein BU17DRAFT_50348 [Hysterangium stoloniferum]
MSNTTATPSQVQNSHGSNANRGRKSRGRGKPREVNATPTVSESNLSVKDLTSGNVADADADGNDSLCWICAEPVKFYSVSECNHRTCHVCALRLRALYKRMDCTFCKHSQLNLIFTRSAEKDYESYLPNDIPFKDTKLSISFETQEMMEDTLLLLRFNCPDVLCDFIAHGWGDLKIHVRSTHGKAICDLCIRFKKVFAHEHILYLPSHLPLHLPSIPHRISQKPSTPDKIEGGVHPMCEFCQECYFGDDELFLHMRERHEECFLCKRSGIRDQYFRDYNSLENHFNVVHHPCKEAHCQAQKFVVFGSALDLKAHLVEQHGSEMTARNRKDARRVEAGFNYSDRGEANGDSARSGQSRVGVREREPPEPGPWLGQGQGQGRNRRHERFGTSLTPVGDTLPAVQRLQIDDQAEQTSDLDPALVERQTIFLNRINALTSSSSNAIPAVRAAIRSYKSSESGPRDLISTIFNVVNRDLDGTASLISSLVELLDDEGKGRALLAYWNGFKIEQRRPFPDLTPVASGSEYAGVAGGRILTVKHSAAVRSSSSQSPGQVWDRVAQAAASSSTSPGPAIRSQDRFPSLSAAKNAPSFRHPQHSTAWSGAGSTSSVSARPLPELSGPRPTPPPSTSMATVRSNPPQISTELFPTLPSGSSKPLPRPTVRGNQSLKHILGEPTAPPSNPWGSKKDIDPSPSPIPADEVDASVQADPMPKGKKKKGKEKQTLFTLGTFPT